MSSGEPRPDDRLIRELAAGLEPVTVVPRLRSSVAVLFGAWALLFASVLVIEGGGQAGVNYRAFATPTYLGSFAGLFVAAAAGSIAAIAAGIPGRELLEGRARLLAIGGLLFAAAVCAIGCAVHGIDHGSPQAADAMCFRGGLQLTLPMLAVAGVLVTRGWVGEPNRAATLLLIGAATLGVLIVHLSCNYVGPRHWLVGHVLVPIAVVVVGRVPLAYLLRRIAR